MAYTQTLIVEGKTMERGKTISYKYLNLIYSGGNILITP
jgi:hypothetical protein